MILKMFTHVVFSSLLLQLFPVDARDLEQAPFQTYSVFTLPTAHLPIAKNASHAPTKLDPTRLGVVTSAVSAIVMDRQSGVILFEKNRESPRSIGSITKLMTSILFLQSNPDLSERVSIQPEDVRLGGIQHIQTNEEVTTRDLLYASLISSDNSATAALVRLSGMSLGDFVAKMNEMAATLGMRQTQFVDPVGLSAKNTSVVTDVVILLDHAAQSETIRDATQRSAYTFQGSSGRTYHIESTDELLTSFVNKDPYQIIAAKTGFLPEAGYCLGTMFNNKEGNEIFVVVLGSESDLGRFQDVKSLAVWAYDVYGWESSK